MEEKNELLPFLEAPRAPAPDPREGLSTPAAGLDTYIGPNSSMRRVTTLSEHVGLQADEEQVLCREPVCVYEELQSCCEHVASALTVHPRVQTLLLKRPSALLQTGKTSEWMCGESMEQQILDIEEIVCPVSPPVVLVCKGILTANSFLFFGTPRHYVMRKYTCWCRACSRVRVLICVFVRIYTSQCTFEICMYCYTLQLLAAIRTPV